jgi:hypothetical protein
MGVYMLSNQSIIWLRKVVLSLSVVILCATGCKTQKIKKYVVLCYSL